MPPIPKTHPSSFAYAATALLANFLLLLTPSAGRAQPLTTVIIQPSQPVAAGVPCSLWLYCLNNSPKKIAYTFEPNLNCTLISTDGSSNAVLTLKPGSGSDTVTIPPAGFVKKEYLLNVALAEGRITLDAPGYNQIALVVENAPAAVSPAPAPVPAAAGAQASPETPFAKPRAPRPIEQFLTKYLSTYEPIYFLLGTYPAAEFQFSLKSRLFTFSEEHNFVENGLDHFYFGFTQTSFWDLLSRDPSFYDSSYKPSLFFYYTNVFQSSDDAILHLDLQPGAEHESNGKGGTGERSLYTGYLQPTATFNLPENFSFMLQPRARDYFLVGENNPDIARYRGYVDLLAALAWKDPNSEEKVEFATKVTLGDTWKYPGLKFDLRFNLARVFWLKAFNPTIQLQYFTGFGQTLLQYNQPSQAFRAGFCLWYF